MSIELTREQLHELVWTKPLATLAAELSTTSYLLTKQCRKLNVPVPTRGHWVKVSFGKIPERPPLPPPDAPPQAPESHETQSPREVSNLCERARAMMAALTNAVPYYDGRQSLEDKQFPRVKVTKPMIEQAARLFHALLVNIETNGILFQKSRSKYEGGFFDKDGDRLYLEIDEPLVNDTESYSWKKKKVIGRGELEVTLFGRDYGNSWKRGWKSSDQGGVRGMVSKIARAVDDYYRELAAKRQREAEQRRLEHERWLKSEEERKQKEHAQAIATAKSTRMADLLMAAEWARLHRSVLDFITECESRWVHDGGGLSPERTAWLQWARAQAEVWSPWATGYPDPKNDGAFAPEDFPYPGPQPAIRKFHRPPTMPEVQVPEQQSWPAAKKEPYPFWIRRLG